MAKKVVITVLLQQLKSYPAVAEESSDSSCNLSPVINSFVLGRERHSVN